MITVITQPQEFSPSNAAIFKVSSDRPNILQFKVVVTDAITGLVMTTTKYGNLPMFPTGTTFDIAPLLKSFIDYDLKPGTPYLYNTEKSLRNYNVQVIELYRDATTQAITEGDDIVVTGFFIYNAILDTFTFSNYDQSYYIMGDITKAAKFLNEKPLLSRTYHDSIDDLYFISSVACRVAIRIYQRPNTLLNTVYITGATANNAYRVNVNPDALIAQFGAAVFATGDSEFDDEFTEQFGSAPNLSNGIYYTVTVEDLSGNAISEVRTFVYAEKPCGKIVSLVWGNDLGGFDSLDFSNFKQSTTTARTVIASNPYQLSSNGDLLAVQNGVFNTDSSIIAVSKYSTFSIISDILNDDFSYFAKGLVESKNVLVRLQSGAMYPVQIVDTNYDVNNRKINSNNNRLGLTFTITDTKIKL